jgi:predicted methyltransferase
MNLKSRFLIPTRCAGPLLAALWLIAAPAGAEGWSAGEFAATLQSSGRSEADRGRDSARQPAEVVVFVGIEPGMTIVDLMAAGGWYTEVLSIAAGPDGTVYAQNPPMMLEFRDGANDKALSRRLSDDRLGNVVRRDGALAETGIETGSVDIAFTALNFHDTYNYGGEEAAIAQLNAIFAILKPGGVLGLVDHNGDPDKNNVKLHRMPKQVAVDLAEQAGFVLVAESDVLAHPEDDHTQMVFGPIRGKTDRFALKLQKPGT